MVTYTKHIIWRFVKHKPEQFKLLDVRHNVVKHLILGDCDHLIKFILFGDGGKNEDENLKEQEKNCDKKQEKQKESEIRRTSVPRNLLWPREKFIDDDDLNHSDKLEDDEEIRPENNMELAIYYCKGR